MTLVCNSPFSLIIQFSSFSEQLLCAQPWGMEQGWRWGPCLAQPGPCGGLLSSPCRAVGHMMSTMFYPLVTFVLLLICIAYWAMTALYPLPTWRALLECLGQSWRAGGDRALLAYTVL